MRMGLLESKASITEYVSLTKLVVAHSNHQEHALQGLKCMCDDGVGCQFPIRSIYGECSMVEISL